MTALSLIAEVNTGPCSNVMAMHSDGFLYTMDTTGHIRRVDPNTLSTVATYTEPGLTGTADFGFAYDPAGYVYASISNGAGQSNCVIIKVRLSDMTQQGLCSLHNLTHGIGAIGIDTTNGYIYPVDDNAFDNTNYFVFKIRTSDMTLITSVSYSDVTQAQNFYVSVADATRNRLYVGSDANNSSGSVYPVQILRLDTTGTGLSKIDSLSLPKDADFNSYTDQVPYGGVMDSGANFLYVNTFGNNVNLYKITLSSFTLSGTSLSFDHDPSACEAHTIFQSFSGPQTLGIGTDGFVYIAVGFNTVCCPIHRYTALMRLDPSSLATLDHLCLGEQYNSQVEGIALGSTGIGATGNACSASSYMSTFRYAPAPPVPLYTPAPFTPTVAGIGDVVTLYGSLFTGATNVTVNGTSATFTVVSDNIIRFTVPNGATRGPIAVTIPTGTSSTALDMFISTSLTGPAILHYS